jgi:hypothetical protein
MMQIRLEELWKSPDDGAYSPVGPLAIRTEADFDDLLDAWYVERRNSIEFEILLDESLRLIQKLVSEGDVSASERKRARRLIRAIESTLRTSDHPEN